MDWGQTVENLKELYPEINFIMSKENEQEVYSHFELVLDIESKVSYFFDKNQLVSGRYIFFSTVGAAKTAIKNFNLISTNHNQKIKEANTQVTINYPNMEMFMPIDAIPERLFSVSQYKDIAIQNYSYKKFNFDFSSAL